MAQDSDTAKRTPDDFALEHEEVDRILVKLSYLPDLSTIGKTAEEIIFIDKVCQAVSSSGFNVPVIPEVAANAIALLKEPDFSMVELNKMILKDPVLVAKILRVANSAVYGGLAEVRTIRQAIVRVGYKTIINVILTTSFVSKLIRRDIFGQKGMDLWKHSTGCAYAARHLASVTSHGIEDAFLAGLLHDIGKVGLMTIFFNLKSKEESDYRRFDHLEEPMLEMASPAIGSLMARGWKFPVDIEESIKYQKEFDKAPNAPRLAATIQMADLSCRHFGIGCERREVDFSREPSSAALDLKGEALEAVIEQLPQVFAWCEQLF